MVSLILKRLFRRLTVRMLSLGARAKAIIALGLLAVFGFALYSVVSGVLMPEPAAAGAVEVSVERIEPNPQTGQILLVLREKAGPRRISMSVPEFEAGVIYVSLQGTPLDQPLSYDLMRDLVNGLGGRVSYVIVNNVTGTSYRAKVVVASDGREVEVDSRPSQAVALALRARAPIFVDRQVMDRAGISSP